MGLKEGTSTKQAGWAVSLHRLLAANDHAGAYAEEIALVAGNVVSSEACSVYGGKCECPCTRQDMAIKGLIPGDCEGSCPVRTWVGLRPKKKDEDKKES